MVSAHRNPVVGAEQASRAEQMLSTEVGASVLDRGRGLEEGQSQGQGLGERQEVPGRGKVSEPTRQSTRVDQGGGQLVDKSAIDLALARAARGESPDAIIEDPVNNMEEDHEEALRQAREEEGHNNREKQKGYLLGWG